MPFKEVLDKCRVTHRDDRTPIQSRRAPRRIAREVFAADALDLRLMKPVIVDSMPDPSGRRAEIKATTRTSIALSAAGTDAERLVVVVFDDNGMGAIAYDGPSQVVWDAAGVPQANGQRRIALSTLQRLASGSQNPLFED